MPDYQNNIINMPDTMEGPVAKGTEQREVMKDSAENTSSTKFDFGGLKDQNTEGDLAKHNSEAYQISNGQRDKRLDENSDDTETHVFMESWRKVCAFLGKKRNIIVAVVKALLLTGYFVYFGFTVAHHVGDEGSWRLIGFTIFGCFLLVWRYVKTTKIHRFLLSARGKLSKAYSTGKRRTIVRW